MSRERIKDARSYIEDKLEEDPFDDDDENVRVIVVKMRDELNNLRGLLRGVQLLIQDDEYKLYVHNPVESAMIVIDQKLLLIDEGLRKL